MSAPRRDDPDAGWSDWVAVQRAVHGVPIGRPLTHSELTEAVGWMQRRGMPRDAIAERVGLSERELQRFLDTASSRRRRLARVTRRLAVAS